MKTHTTLLLPTQFSPTAWNILCLAITLACMKHNNFRPHTWGFSAFTVLGKPGNITAIMFHSAFHPDTPPELEQEELDDFTALRKEIVGCLT